MIAPLQELARQMLADYDARTPGQLVASCRGLTTAQAYALQAEIAHLREARGECVIGYKVGCTSKVIQQQLGMQEPIFGRLFDVDCHASGVHLSSARYANLAVEGETAVRLAHDLLSVCPSPQECLEAIAEVFPIIELHHYVLPAAWPRGPWLIASNGMHAGFVTAEAYTVCTGMAKFAHGISIRIDDVEVGAVARAESLTCPVESMRWLAGRLAQFGLRLCKGQIILTGSPMNLYPVSAGSRIVVEAPPLGASRVVMDD